MIKQFVFSPRINPSQAARKKGSHCVAQVPSVVASGVVSPMSDCGRFVSVLIFWSNLEKTL